MISEELRYLVRSRAGFACEYCGISETDSGGELTIDHFKPKSKEGTDDQDNLVYCCLRCNLHKRDFWPTSSAAIQLWNPRHDPFEKHFVVSETGMLEALTDEGALSLKILRLNRPSLVEHRLIEKQLKSLLRFLLISSRAAASTYDLLTRQSELISGSRLTLESGQASAAKNEQEFGEQ